MEDMIDIYREFHDARTAWDIAEKTPQGGDWEQFARLEDAIEMVDMMDPDTGIEGGLDAGLKELNEKIDRLQDSIKDLRRKIQ